MNKTIKIMLMAFAIMALALGTTGCNSNSGGGSIQSPAPAPEPAPTPPVVIPDPGPETPGTGLGSLNYVPSCLSGYATVTYVYRDEANIDPNSFVLLHNANGERQSITTGSVSSNGSVSRMEQQIYIAPNDSENQIAHSVNVQFVADGVSQVNSFGFIQPTCDVEVPIDPEVDPDEPVDPVDPVEPVDPSTAAPYAPNTPYAVGDVITIVDGVGVERMYVCNTAYVSGFQGSWLRFRNQEQGNWTRVANIALSIDLGV